MATMVERKLEATKKEMEKANKAVARAEKKAVKMATVAKKLDVVMSQEEFKLQRQTLSQDKQNAYYDHKWAQEELVEQLHRQERAVAAHLKAQTAYVNAAPLREKKQQEQRELDRYTGKNFFAETHKVFEGLLAEMKAAAEIRRRNYYNKIRDAIAAYIKLGQTTKHDLMKNGPYPYMPGKGYTEIHKLVDSFLREYRKNGDYSPFYGENSYPQERNLIDLRTDVDSIITCKVNRDIDEMFSSFIQKQTLKTGAIIKGRHPTIKGRITPGSLECYLTFDLDDNSHFEMKCQIVWKTSYLGTNFYQFPTTFHNARKANGEEIKNPSEVKLKKEL